MFQMYQHEFWHRPGARPPSPWPLQLLPAILASLVLAAGLWPEPLMAFGRDAAAALSRGGYR
jgi:multicomponent Na+:H+ antiporter subunit D